MRFLKNEIIVKLLHVYKFDRVEVKNHVKRRDFHALSYRINSNAMFQFQNIQASTKKGSITYIPPNFSYQITSKYDEVIVVRFKAYGSDGDFEIFEPDNHLVYYDLFQSMLTEWENKKRGYKYKCTALLYQVFSLLEIQNEENSLINLRYKIMNAVEYIHAHFLDSGINIRDLAAMCNMSETYFRKIFLTVFKITPLKYINRLRITYALELLQSGDYTVNDVAIISGFSDAKYFSTVFKKIKGNPPSFYLI